MTSKQAIFKITDSSEILDEIRIRCDSRSVALIIDALIPKMKTQITRYAKFNFDDIYDLPFSAVLDRLADLNKIFRDQYIIFNELDGDIRMLSTKNLKYE